MKLVEINIAGFGKLSGVRIGFGEGLNSFKWDNGEGKSTLCEFITAMFYGMDTAKSNEKEFGMRSHYLPFGGGVFGGSLVYKDVIDGREHECRIERTFDSKSETKDTLTFYVDGEKQDGKKDVGYSVFGVGADTFRKLVYMNPFSMVPQGNSEINGKIGNFAGDETNRFTKAREAIDSAKKELRAKRAGPGGGGRIPVLEKEIDSLKMKVRGLEAKKKDLEEKYAAREEILSDIDQCKKTIDAFAVRQRLIEKWEDYESRAAAVASKEQKLAERSAGYPAGFPEDAEIDRMCGASRELDLGRRILDSIGLTSGDRSRHEKIGEYIAAARPCAYGDESDFGVDFDRLEGDIVEIASLSGRAGSREDALINGSGADGRDTLERRFAGREEEAEKLAGEIGALEKTIERTSRELEKATQENNAREEKIRRGATVKAIAGAVLLTLGAAALAVGIILAATGFSQKALAFGLMGGGAALAIIGVVLFIARAASLNSIKDNTALESLRSAFKSSKDELTERLLAFGPEYVGEHGTALFAEHFRSYKSDKKRIESEKAEISNIRERADGAEKAVRDFLGKFDISGVELRQGLDALRNMKNEYLALTAKIEKSRAESKKIENAKAVLSDFTAKYMPGTNAAELLENPESVRNDKEFVTALAAEIRGEKDALEGFRTGLGNEGKPGPIDPYEKESAEEKLKDCESRLRENEIFIRRTEIEVAAIGECEAAIGEAQEKLSDACVFYAELDAADKLIEQAERDLKERYIGPVSRRFEAYRETLSDAIGADVTMRRDFTVQYESNGAIRKQDYLSTGQLACVALCVRMALTEGVIGGDRCFFVLDDPFMSLSSKNLGAVKALLKKISADKQVIYLTCSDERMI